MRVIQCGVRDLISSANLTRCVNVVIFHLELNSIIINPPVNLEVEVELHCIMICDMTWHPTLIGAHTVAVSNLVNFDDYDRND